MTTEAAERMVLNGDESENSPCEEESLSACILETLNLLDEELAEWEALENREESDSTTRGVLEAITNQQEDRTSIGLVKSLTPIKTPSQRLVQSIQRLRAASIRAKKGQADAIHECKSLVSHFEREVEPNVCRQNSLLEDSANHAIKESMRNTVVLSLEDLEDDSSVRNQTTELQKMISENKSDKRLEQQQQSDDVVERELELLAQLSGLRRKYIESERKRSDAEMRAGIEAHARLSVSMKFEKAMKRVNEQETVIASLQQRVKDYSSQTEYLSDALQLAQLEARESLEDRNLSMPWEGDYCS